MRWDAHVDALCAQVASRLYFFKILKRSGLLSNDLLCFRKCVIRSVVEYGCVVWHHNLTTAQSDRLQALQKRALRIILHPNHTILLLPTARLNLLNSNDMIFRINSLNRFVVLTTASTTCCHPNVTLLFLSYCGILQFTLSPSQNKSVLLIH